MEVVKDINDIYKSLLNFWDTISPAFGFNIVFFIAFTFITGIKIISLQKIEQWLSSEKFSRIKNVAKTIGFENKLSWTFIFFAILFYLVVFTSLLNIVFALKIPFVSAPTVNEIDFYAERKPIAEMANIARFSAHQPPSLQDVVETKRIVKEQFEQMDTKGYEASNANKNYSELVRDITLSKLAILSLVLSTILFIRSKQKNNKKWWIYTLRFLGFLALNIIVLLNINWWIYLDVEKHATQELAAVSNYADTRYYATRGYPYELPKDSLPSIKTHLLIECNKYNNSKGSKFAGQSFFEFIYRKK